MLIDLWCVLADSLSSKGGMLLHSQRNTGLINPEGLNMMSLHLVLFHVADGECGCLPVDTWHTFRFFACLWFEFYIVAVVCLQLFLPPCNPEVFDATVLNHRLLMCL